jgi:hypothetical protein
MLTEKTRGNAELDWLNQSSFKCVERCGDNSAPEVWQAAATAAAVAAAETTSAEDADARSNAIP